MVLARCLCVGTEECMAMRRTAIWCNPPTQCQTNTCLLSGRSHPLFSVTSCTKQASFEVKMKQIPGQDKVQKKAASPFSFPKHTSSEGKEEERSQEEEIISVAIIVNSNGFLQQLGYEGKSGCASLWSTNYSDVALHNIQVQCVWCILICMKKKPNPKKSRRCTVKAPDGAAVRHPSKRYLHLNRASAHHLHNNNKTAALLPVTSVEKCHILIPILSDGKYSSSETTTDKLVSQSADMMWMWSVQSQKSLWNSVCLCLCLCACVHLHIRAVNPCMCVCVCWQTKSRAWNQAGEFIYISSFYEPCSWRDERVTTA